MNQFLVRQGHWSYNKTAQSHEKPRTNEAAKSEAAKRSRDEEPRRGAAPRTREEPRKESRDEEPRTTKPRRGAAKKAAQRREEAASRTDADEAEGSKTGRWTPHT